MEKTLYMIGNAHIDAVWLWRWQDGFSEIRATFRSALDRMNETPGFIFTCAAAAYYAWVEENDPAMFAEIQQRVAEGRWAIAGGWWIQPDCNIPSGESLARQTLYGQRYFLERFGTIARTGYNVDSFGHSGSIPKILRKSGMSRYVFMRPGSHEMSLPASLFCWQSPEGQGVTAFRLPYDYCSWGKELTAHISRYASELTDPRGFMCFYGVGNHGGGPTRENLASIAALNGKDGLRLVLSSPDDYFDQAAEKGGPLPAVTGDLLHHASGCYSAHSGIKQWNRQAENRLATAEKWSALAHVLLGRPYQAAALDEAWKKVLFNQFHDTLAGTCLMEAYDDARQDYGFALSTADWLINDAQQALMQQVDIPSEEGTRPLVAFNPQAFECRWPVTLDLAAVAEDCVLVDAGGEEIPYQLIAPAAATGGRQRITFAPKLPALGYGLFRLVPKAGYRHPRPAPNRGDLVLENAWLRAEFCPETGSLIHLLEKSNGTEMLREPSAAQIIRDESDTWSHAVLRFDQVIATMSLVRIERVEEGDCCATVRVTLGHENSLLVQDFTLYRDMPILFVKAQVNWQEELRVLKLRYALPHNNLHVTSQAPFGYADRPANGEEFPMQQWVDVTGIPRGDSAVHSGLAILNDAKYSFDVHDRAIHLTVLRSPYYAHHDPYQVQPGDSFPVVDQGWQSFQYALMPHIQTAQNAGVDRAAALLNAPPQLLPESYHVGAWPGAQGFASVDAENVLLDALKLTYDGSGDLIVRMHETARRRTCAVLSLPLLSRRIPLTFSPGEIITLRIPQNPDAPAQMVNLMELAE